MSLTAQDYQDLIVKQVGDTDDALVAEQIATLWALRETVATLSLRFLYVKRDAIDLLLGHEREEVDQSESRIFELKLSQKFDHLIAIRATVDADIQRRERTRGGPVSGALTQTAPVMPCSPCTPDANDRRYAGDPYRPPTTWRP